MSEHFTQNSAAEAQAPRRAFVDPDLLGQILKTVASLTKPWWRGEVVSENGLIYGVNTGGSRPPLFWCFQGYQEFANFARALGPDQPLYGMRSGHMVVETSRENHIHLSLIYAAEIQSLGLSGQIFLGGNCQGALMAQKTAQILIAHGSSVALLISLNPFFFTPYSGRAALIVGRHDITNPLQRFHDAEAVLRANMPHCSVDTLPSEHGKLFAGRIVSLLSDIVRRRMDEAAGTFPGSFPVWSLRAEFSLSAPPVMAPGSLCDVAVTVKNTSDMAWEPTQQSGLSVGNHWRSPDGSTVLQWLDGMAALSEAILPGASADLSLLVRAPAAEGDFQLEIDLEHAGIMWLSELGGPRTTCTVSVNPAA